MARAIFCFALVFATCALALSLDDYDMASEDLLGADVHSVPYRALSTLGELEKINVHNEDVEHVERLIKSAHLKALTDIEHIGDRTKHADDLQRRRLQYIHEHELQPAAEETDKKLHSQESILSALQQQLQQSSNTVAHDQSEVESDRRELEHYSEQHKSMLRVVLLRRRRLERIRAMQDSFREKGVAVPHRLIVLEQAEQNKVADAESAVSQLASRVAKLQVAVADGPKRMQADFDRQSQLTKAVQDASNALHELHEAEVPFYQAVKEDATEIMERLQPRIQRTRNVGKDGLRATISRLLAAADSTSDLATHDVLVAKAKELATAGRAVFDHLGAIAPTAYNADEVAAQHLAAAAAAAAAPATTASSSSTASSTTTTTTTTPTDVHPDVLAAHVAAATLPFNASAPAIASLPDDPSNSTFAPSVDYNSTLVNQHLANAPVGTAASLLRQCLIDAQGIRAALKAHHKDRKEQLMNIGFCLDKIDRLQRLKNKWAKKSSKNDKPQADIQEDEEEEDDDEEDDEDDLNDKDLEIAQDDDEEEETVADVEEESNDDDDDDNETEEDQESSDLVLASALEMLQIDPKAAENHGPQFIQRQLVSMGMELRRKDKAEYLSYRAHLDNCHKYCAGATFDEISAIRKLQTTVVAAVKDAHTLKKKLLMSQGAISEAKRFFISSRGVSKSRLADLREDLSILQALSDHVEALDSGAEPTEDDAQLMASLEVMASRRPLAKSLLQVMTSASPSLAEVRSLIFSLRNSLNQERTAILNQLKVGKLRLKKRVDHVVTLRDQYTKAYNFQKTAKKALQRAQGRTVALHEKCKEMRENDTDKTAPTFEIGKDDDEVKKVKKAAKKTSKKKKQSAAVAKP